MSHTYHTTVRGVVVRIIVNGDWSGDATVVIDRCNKRAPIECEVPAMMLVRGTVPDTNIPKLVTRFEWALVVMLANNTYVRHKIEATIEDVLDKVTR